MLAENNCNSYLIDAAVRVLIDPGHQHLLGELVGSLASLTIRPDDIDLVIGTHAHPDHIEALQSFSSSSSMIAMGELEYRSFQKAAQLFGFRLEPDFLLTEGTLKVGPTVLEVILTPGHSPGSICLYWPARKALFAGDVIFEQGVGRTDLSGGSGNQLKESIKRISSLDIELLLPGHGNIVRGKEEVKRNFSLVEEMYFGYL
jgi:glyoxylase-like metal-dependent hydrolase (beta-lactamase superfamily II)